MEFKKYIYKTRKIKLSNKHLSSVNIFIKILTVVSVIMHKLILFKK